MNDTELYQIVKDHKDAWPMGAERVDGNDGRVYVVMDGDSSLTTTMLSFEASFHRALMARGDDRGDVYASHFRGTYTVQIDDHDFCAPTLIEAYAKALEWLK